MRSLGTSVNDLGRQVTVFDKLGEIKTTIGTGCQNGGICAELNNIESLIGTGTNNLGRQVTVFNKLDEWAI